jgi:putative sterol carrier protein
VETYNTTAAVGDMLAAFSPKKETAAADDAGGGLTVQGAFDNMKDAFQADKAAGVDVVFQFNISGPSGGAWYAVIKDGACEISEGTHDSPTTTIIMADEDFVSLMQGQLNAMVAYTSGKLKIEGDLMKSQLIEKLFKF